MYEKSEIRGNLHKYLEVENKHWHQNTEMQNANGKNAEAKRTKQCFS